MGLCSIVLMGIVDAEHKSFWVSVRNNRSASNAGVFSELYLRIAQPLERRGNTIGFHLAELFPQGDSSTPYFTLGDEAVPLQAVLHQKDDI